MSSAGVSELALEDITIKDDALFTPSSFITIIHVSFQNTMILQLRHMITTLYTISSQFSFIYKTVTVVQKENRNLIISEKVDKKNGCTSHSQNKVTYSCLPNLMRLNRKFQYDIAALPVEMRGAEQTWEDKAGTTWWCNV